MEVFFNRMQREVCAIDAHTNVIVAGRGTGKSVLHAWINLRNFQQMPRSTTAFVTPTAIRAKTNTLPSMFQHWEDWGYHRGVHWDIGHRPPRALGWPDPIVVPDNWENVISFYTGAIGQIISQDRVGTSNSKSFDYIDIDEAKFVNFERLKDETFPANRGQQREFGDLPFHHGMLVTSDMPVTKTGSWFMRYEKDLDPELISTIEALTAEELSVSWRIAQGDTTPYLPRKLAEVQRVLSTLRKHATLFRRYSSLTNIEVLGEAWIKQMRRDLPPMVFRTSILCQSVSILKDGFYSSMQPRNKYTATDHSKLDALGYDFKAIGTAANTCRLDSDLMATHPLIIAFDFNANINWLVCGQVDEDRRRLNVVKSFYVKYDRKLPELVADFCQYYAPFPLHEVIFYYDSTALGSNYAVNDQDFQWVITHELQKHGWRVRPVYIGAPMRHMEKYTLINRGFAGQARLVPYFNEAQNQDLLVSVQTAGVYNGKKDKRGEKLAETEEDKLESRTDGSDAFDTLYIGCERFPQQVFVLRVTGGG